MLTDSTIQFSKKYNHNFRDIVMFTNTTFVGLTLAELIYTSPNSLIYKTVSKNDSPKAILKVLKESSPERERIRFYQEFSIAKKINSPYVAKVFDLIKNDSTIGILVEDIDAESVKTWIEKQGLSIADKLTIAIAVCKGLQDIHRVGVIHKDISSSNVLWNPETNTVKIIDFGISSILSKESVSPEVLNKLDGEFFYMSPEQTGRMNRPIDYRTDFYSLGVTLYEMFTDKLPFYSKDPLKLIHAHIAKLPVLPEKINAKIPVVLSKIIMKLLQKTPENRYQTANGIMQDLIEIRRQYHDAGIVSDFIIGTKDLSDCFVLPTKLYGRDKPVAQLEHSFQQVCQGSVILSLVRGYSGVGKTATVQELYRPIAIARGLYIHGKFDQYHRNIPYSALGTALNGFCSQILEETNEALSLWKSKILTSVHNSGQLLIEIIPNLEKIIDSQPAVSKVDPQSTQNRFNEVFINFMSAACSPEKPLVIFLDDLQWADQASLKLIHQMALSRQIKGLHIIGAYRDNEVEASHPLTLMLDEITKANQTYDIVNIGNLTETDLTSLVAATLSVTQKKVKPLSSLIYKKTLGNAFYSTEFFKNLYFTGLLSYTERKWFWNLKKIEKEHVSENVVDFMAIVIKRLSTETQEALKIAACMGNTFSIDKLSIILYSEIALEQTLQRLFPAIEAGIIIPKNDLYKSIGITDVNPATILFIFQHDRVQQAAYSLIDIKELPHLQQKIGNHLLDYATKAKDVEQQLFEIVNHLNQSLSLVKKAETRLIIAKLNYRSGIKAIAASAYQASLDYFLQAKNLLPTNCFEKEYEFSFSVYLHLAESFYINHLFSESGALYPLLLKCAKTKIDTVKVNMIKIEDYQLQGLYEESLDIQKDALALLDDPVPEDEDFDTAIVDEFKKTSKYMNHRNKTALLNAENITSPALLAELRILLSMWLAAYLVSKESVGQWCAIKMANITLQFGNSEFASLAFVQYAYILTFRLDKAKEGYQFGILALKLADRYTNIEMRGRVYFLFALFINHRVKHISTSTDFFRKSYLLNIESGDWAYAVYSGANILSNLLIEGKPCYEVAREGQKYFEFLKDKANVAFNSFFLTGGYIPLLNLQGKTESRDSFNCEYFNEKTMLDTLGKLPIVEAWFYSAKIRSLFLFRALDKAMLVIDKADMVLAGVPSQIKVPEAFFYSALVITATFNTLNDNATKQAHLTRFENYKLAFERWSQDSPENFLHKWLLLRAEECWLKEMALHKTLALYDLAFEEAKKAGYLNVAAVAQELKGRFWLHNNQADYGLIHLKNAYKLYQNWGVLEKSAQLAEEFSEIKNMSLLMLDTSRIFYTNDFDTSQIDYQSIYKLAQSLSQNLEWEKLTYAILTIVMENVGASRSALILNKKYPSKHHSSWFVDAVAQVSEDEKSVIFNSADKLAIEKATNYPLSILHHAINVDNIINVDSSESQSPFKDEPFFRNKKDISVICAPIKLRNELIGIIYLENVLTSHAFDKGREDILKIFLSQIAISIENARLFTDTCKVLEERNAFISLAEARNEELKSFAYIVSHDLKAPLQGISTLIQWIEKDKSNRLSDETKENFQLILRRNKSMGSLIDGILDYSRAGNVNLNILTVDTNQLLKEVVENLNPPKDFIIKSEKTLPIFETAKIPFSQILSNLISNAIKHHDKKQGTIRLGVRKIKTFFEFYVADDGPGIEPEYHKKIFEMFQTLEPKDSTGNTGIGLSIVKKIVESRGGCIRVESGKDKGVIFYFTWPIFLPSNIMMDGGIKNENE